MSQLLCSAASPICAVKPVTLQSLPAAAAAALIHHSTSSLSHPDHVADLDPGSIQLISSVKVEIGKRV